MEFNYTWLFPITGIPTIILGWWLAYQNFKSTRYVHPSEVNWKPTVFRFLLLQSVLIVRHPVNAFVIHLFGFFMGPLTLFALLINSRIFNLLDTHMENVQMRQRDDFEREHGTRFRVLCEEDGQRRDAWLREVKKAEINCAVLVEHISRILSRFTSYAMLVLGIILAPFGIGVKKANAQQREGQMIEETLDPREAPFVPEPVTVHGAFAFGPTIMVPTDSSDTTAVTRLRQLDLSVLPRVSRTVSGRVVLAFAKFTDGPADPVNVAAVDWQAMDSLRVSAGRILNPIGLSRQPPPHKLIELIRADTGITAPFFENGAVATWTPLSTLAFTTGVLSGQGTSTKSDTAPDVIGQVKIKPTRSITLGLEGQTGSQPNGWRHVLGTHIQYDDGMFLGQAEAVANFESGQDRPTIGWYTLAVLRPTKTIEPYARVEQVHDLREQAMHRDPIATTGFNFKPTSNVALRAATSAPIAPMPILGFQFAVQATF